MKKLISIIVKLKFILLLSILFSIFYSCNSENEDLHETNTEAKEVYFEGQVQDANYKVSPFELSKQLSCGVLGLDCGTSNQTLTYIFNTSSSNPSISWTVDSGNITILSGQGSNTVSLLLGSFFNGGFVTVSDSGSPNCSVTFEILKCGSTGGGGGGDSCSCRSPIIDDVLCVSGGHPHWRFQVNGVSSADDITWSINHGTIHTNPHDSYVIIEPNSGSTHGFTVYCKVIRTCSNGTKSTRTAYYTNYYGNNCGTGTTGYTTANCVGGTGGGLGGGHEILP